MFSTEKYTRIKKQLDRYFMPAQINSQFILQAIKQQQKKMPSPSKIKKGTLLKMSEEAKKLDFLKITGKELNSNFIPLNLVTPKPRQIPYSKNNTSKKLVESKQIRAILEEPMSKYFEKLFNDPEAYMFENELIQLQKYIKETENTDLSEELSTEQMSASPYLKKNIDKSGIQTMIINNKILYNKLLLLYRKQKLQREKSETSYNISPRKSNLVDGIISRRATGTIKKFMDSAIEKNMTQAQFKKHHSFIKYRQFLLAINVSNRIMIYPENHIQYKAFICKGNNGVLVKSIIKSRPWWGLRSYSDIDNCCMVWTEWKKNKINDRLPTRAESVESQRNTFYINNHKRNSQYRTEESWNRKQSFSSKNQEALSKLQVKREKLQILNGSQSNEILMKYINLEEDSIFTFTRRINEKKFEEISKKYIAHSYHNFREDSSGRAKSSSTSQLKNKSLPLKIVNHLPGCLQLHSKKLLFTNLKNYYEKSNKDVFDILPETYIVASICHEDETFKKFSEAWNRYEKQKNESGKVKNIWICKPGQNSNRGHGIIVTNSIDQIKALIKSRNINRKRTLLIQKYIENPYIYQKRKFDIRGFVLFTCVNGYLKCYWYTDGYIRTASKQFSLKNLDNKYIHLTNDAIQKKSEEYGKFENCNKICFSEFQKYLQLVGDDPKKFRNAFQKMKEICFEMASSCAYKLNPKHREYCFQIFGMDFMLDSKLKPYLIEANSNPCLEVDGTTLSKIIPAMIQNSIKIAIDPIFPPPYSEVPKSSKFSPSNPFDTNKFELIYDSATDSTYRQKLSDLGPQIFEDEEEQQQQQFENNKQQ